MAKESERKRRRSLTEDEKKLWRIAMKDARPLDPEKVASLSDTPSAEPPSAASSEKSAPLPPKPLPVPVRPRPAGPPPLTGLDRRLSQRLARGQMEVEATLDLHGHSQERAYTVLLDFLVRSRSRGLRCVLIITGKGASPYARHTLHGVSFYEVPERQGVLRGAVPRWLNEEAFRLHASGFQPAHPKHGGGGAFYVWLRKKR
jgi:DNA-nicking Smr family endonuclease